MRGQNIDGTSYQMQLVGKSGRTISASVLAGQLHFTYVGTSNLTNAAAGYAVSLECTEYSITFT